MLTCLRSLAGFLLLVFCAAGCGRPDERSRDRDEEPLTYTRTAIDASLGDTATSSDGLFSVIIPRQFFNRNVWIRIDQVSDTMPSGVGFLSEAYAVSYEPAEALVIGPTYEIEFVLGSDDVVDPADLGVGVRQADAGTYESVLIRPYVSWIDWKTSLHAQVNVFGSFVALDVAAAGCACDTSTSCQQNCGCDLDCEGQNGCGLGEWECGNAQCIPAALECNNVVDCTDGTDEGGHCYAVGADAFEPDNGFGQAGEIAIGETQTHSMHYIGDIDYAFFVTDDWSNATVETRGDVGDTRLLLYDSAFAPVASDDDSGIGSFSLIVRNQLPPGRYYVAVEEFGNNGTIPSYTLTVTTTPAEPLLLAPTGVTVSNSGGVLTVSWTPNDIATSYRVYYDEEALLPYDPAYGATEGNSPVETSGVQQTLSGLPSGLTYYIAVSSVNSTGESTLSSQVVVMTPLSADPYEEDNIFEQARAIESGEAQRHSLHAAGDADFVTFTIGATSDVAIATDGLAGDTVLYLYDAARLQLAYDDQGGNGSFSRIVRNGLAPGQYFVKAVSYYSFETIPIYTLTLYVGGAVSAPANVVATPGDGSISISWDPAPGAVSYYIYYDENGGPSYYPSRPALEGYPPLIVTSGTSYTLTGLPNGITYYVAVSAYNGITESARSADVSAMPSGTPDSFEPDDDADTAKPIDPSAPQMHSLHVLADADWVSFTLDAQRDVIVETAGAAGNTLLTLYDANLVLLASDDDSGVDLFSRLTRPSLPPGTYYARVSVSAASSSVESYTLSLTLLEPPAAPVNLLAVAGAGSVTLSWDAVPGAVSYHVYYDDDPNNPPYSPSIPALQGASPVTLPETTITLTGLPAGVVHYFAVTALSELSESAASPQVTATPE